MDGHYYFTDLQSSADEKPDKCLQKSTFSEGLQDGRSGRSAELNRQRTGHMPTDAPGMTEGSAELNGQKPDKCPEVLLQRA